MTSYSAVVSFSILVGLAVSVDIFFYTLAKATVEKLTYRNWTIPTATAHFVLMGLVCGASYTLGRTFDLLHIPLGLLGTSIIGLYLYEITCAWRGVIPIFSLTVIMEKNFGGNRLLSWLKPRVLAVSWDCIPVAAGIALVTETWSLIQLGLGLLVVGITVAFAAQSSLVLVWAMRRFGFQTSFQTKVRTHIFGKWVVLSLLGGFGFLSFIQGFSTWLGGWEPEITHFLPLTGMSAALFFYWHREVLWEEQRLEIQKNEAET